jgi:CheY-like chemotaxis protein
MPEVRLTPDELRALVDRVFLELGVTASWPRVAPPLEFAPALFDRRVVMVDDSPDMMAAFVPALLAATNGRAQFLLHQGESAEEVVERVLELKPDLVLMDGELVGKTRGWTVTAELFKRTPDLPTIGFSSSATYEPHFLASNAGAFVLKNIRMIPLTMANLNREALALLDP